MLRTVIGVIALTIALVMIGAGLSPPVSWQVVVMGVLLAAAVIFERGRYRNDAAGTPPLPWVETGERFVDPDSKRLVAVWTHPATGARRYVDAGARHLPPG